MDFFDVCVWSNAEINVGIWCICMPALRLVLVQLFPKLLGTAQRYRDKYSNLGNKSAENRQPRSRIGNHSTSQGSEEARRQGLGQIRYQKSFAVKYDDTDDLELAIATITSDSITAKSTTSVSVRESSDG